MILVKKKVIAVDLDNVLAKFGERLCETISECEGENISSSDIKCWDIHKYFKCGTKVYEYMTEDLFRNLPVIENSQESIKKLMEDFEVVIVTSATNNKNSLKAKLEWLEEHFPFISHENIILCGNKRYILCDYMIDDYYKNLDGTMGYGILFDSHHNKDVETYPRANNWQEVLDIIYKREESLKESKELLLNMELERHFNKI